MSMSFAPTGERFKPAPSVPGGRSWYIILDYLDTEASKTFDLTEFSEQLQDRCGSYDVGSWEMGLRFNKMTGVLSFHYNGLEGRSYARNIREVFPEPTITLTRESK